MAIASKSWLGISSLFSASAMYRAHISPVDNPVCSALAGEEDELTATTASAAAIVAGNRRIMRISLNVEASTVPNDWPTFQLTAVQRHNC
ncbi:MAG: hypothetical protein O3A94_12320 [Proteobacteria bacterium]|nr:hypothetical protein [Pseudomonadota bacterium]